jgi:hypothetical protein
MMRALLCALLLCLMLPAHAHKPSDSYLTLKVAGAQVEGQWDIALRDLDVALNLDQDANGELTWDEVRARHDAIAAYALGHLTLANCALTAGEQLIDNHTDGAYTVLRFTAACPEKRDSLEIGYSLFAEFDPQHKGLLKLESGGATTTAIFSPEHARQVLSLRSPSTWTQFADYVQHGVWHIWIGFDHILFLLSLLLPAVLLRLRPAFTDVLKVVTAFTLAHSITLTLASLHLVALPSRWVEKAIAASVVLAALNNIFPLFRGHRPHAAFAFGLLHGFGFASVLADLGLPQGALALSLAGFNVGVELGQLAIVAVFLPLAYLVRDIRYYRQATTGGSALIALVAAVWLFERAFDLKLMPA